MPLATAFIPPCTANRAAKPPAGPGWVREIHDGYRFQVRRDGDGIRLFTRRGYDRSGRYSAIAGTVPVFGASARPRCAPGPSRAWLNARRCGRLARIRSEVSASGTKSLDSRTRTARTLRYSVPVALGARPGPAPWLPSIRGHRSPSPRAVCVRSSMPSLISVSAMNGTLGSAGAPWHKVLGPSRCRTSAKRPAPHGQPAVLAPFEAPTERQLHVVLGSTPAVSSPPPEITDSLSRSAADPMLMTS